MILEYAIEKEFRNTISYLISQKNTNLSSIALKKAIQSSKSKEFIIFLIECGEKIDGNLIEMSVQHCSLEVVKFFVENYRNSIFHFADLVVDSCANKDFQVFLFLFEFEKFYIAHWHRSSQQSLIHSACLHGNLEILKYLISMKIANGLHLDELNNNEENSLWMVCKGGHLESYLYLMEIHKFDLNQCDISEAQSPLHCACLHQADNPENSHQRIEIVKHLVNNGADLHKQDLNGYTALHLAIGSNLVEVVKFLISKGSIVNQRNKFGETALFMAAEFETDMEIVKLLVENGAELDARDHHGSTPLFNALKLKNLELTKYLIEKGCELTIFNKYIDSSIFFVLPNDFFEPLGKFLIEKGVDLEKPNKQEMTALMHAISPVSKLKNENQLERVQHFIKLGANVNLHINSQSPLSLACMLDDCSIVKCLIENGAVLDDGALIFARLNQSMNIMKYLVESGVVSSDKAIDYACWGKKIDKDFLKYLVEEKKADPNGGMYGACNEGNLDIVKYLVEHGADPNQVIYHTLEIKQTEINKYLLDKGISNLTECLMMAWELKNIATVKYMIEKEGLLDFKAEKIEKFLYDVCLKEYFEIADRLIEKGVNLIYALKMASIDQNFKILKYLVGKGADPNEGLQIACDRSNWETVKYLVELGAFLDYKYFMEYALKNAFEMGELDFVKWLVENGVPWNRLAQPLIQRARKEEKLDLLKCLLVSCLTEEEEEWTSVLSKQLEFCVFEIIGIQQKKKQIIK